MENKASDILKKVIKKEEVMKNPKILGNSTYFYSEDFLIKAKKMIGELSFYFNSYNLGENAY